MDKNAQEPGGPVPPLSQTSAYELAQIELDIVLLTPIVRERAEVFLAAKKRYQETSDKLTELQDRLETLQQGQMTFADVPPGYGPGTDANYEMPNG